MFNNIRSALGGVLHRSRARRAMQEVLTEKAELAVLEDWTRSLTDPTGYYLDCVRYFHNPDFPPELREHRNYFLKEQRGFGEDAFHVMWWMIFREIRPSRFLEIGVYRGQTLSLASLLQRKLGINGSVTGISPFTASGDSVSRYREKVDYLADTRTNFTHFRLVEPELVQAFSTEVVAIERVKRESWSAIYVDGNHDYEIARADWELCAAHLLPGGVIVLDDSAMGTAYTPRPFATAGHPGPSRLAREIDPSVFREVLRVGHNRVFQKP
jgi:hypothetical protein